MKLANNLLKIGATVILSSSFIFGTSSFANTKPAAISSDELNILADIAVIDKTEILLAVVATNKKTSGDIMHFAELMIEQHGNNLTQILEMANSFHLKILSDSQSNQLATHGHQDLLTIGGLQGELFDKAYIDGMVKGHQAALELIDNQLIKKAKTESIKNFLNDTRAVVVQHLEKAKKIQATFNPSN